MKTRFLIIVVVVLSCVFSIPHVFAEMTFSEFQIFCSEIESQNWELYSIEQRQRSLLCSYSDILSEKYYDWIGIDRNWKNFAEQVSLEYAQEIPQYSETGIADSLIVNAFVSGRESFPPPMGARISFYYLDGNETKRFFEVYHVNLLGDFEKIMDYRTPTLKLFKMGYDIDEIKCKENLFLVQKYDGSPACVESGTEWELIDRGWTTVTFSEDKIDVKQITGAEILNFSFDDYNKSIIIQIDSFSNGQLIITIPRNVLDSKIKGMDDDFFVLIDGDESDFQETKNAIEHTFTIPFENGTNAIEITIPTQI